MLKIPEVILFKSLTSIYKLISDDYKEDVEETKTLLYLILKKLNLQRYEFFDQAKDVLITDPDDPSKLQINMFFNKERANLPTIHIGLGNERKHKDGIGVEENQFHPVVDGSERTYKNVTTRRYSSSLDIGITSSNTNEVVLLYHFTRALLIMIITHLELSGLQNLHISGGDININSQLVPDAIFMRMLSIHYEYEVVVPSFIDNRIITNIFLEQQLILPEQLEPC